MYPTASVSLSHIHNRDSPSVRRFVETKKGKTYIFIKRTGDDLLFLLKALVAVFALSDVCINLAATPNWIFNENHFSKLYILHCNSMSTHKVIMNDCEAFFFIFRKNYVIFMHLFTWFQCFGTLFNSFWELFSSFLIDIVFPTSENKFGKYSRLEKVVCFVADSGEVAKSHDQFFSFFFISPCISREVVQSFSE